MQITFPHTQMASPMSHFQNEPLLHSTLHLDKEVMSYPPSLCTETKSICTHRTCSIVPHVKDWSILLCAIPRLRTISPLKLKRLPYDAFNMICCPEVTNSFDDSLSFRSASKSVLHNSWKLDGLKCTLFWAGHWCGVNSMLIRLKHNAHCLLWNEASQNPLRRLLIERQ